MSRGIPDSWARTRPGPPWLSANGEAGVSIGHAFGGRFVKTTGDGVLLQFPSIVAAVECAVLMQKMMAERNAALPEDKRILYRIGVNLGDVLNWKRGKEVGLTCQVSRPRELDTSWRGSWR
jgi:hypothetical protein